MESSLLFRYSSMIMTPGPKSRAGGIVLSGTLNNNNKKRVTEQSLNLISMDKKYSHIGTTRVSFDLVYFFAK